MSNDKVKVYKNPARSKNNEGVVRQPYVPQYQVLGLDPKEHESRTLPANVLITRGSSSDDNPRIRRPSVRLPYAEVADTFLSIGNDPIPNVGNNIEQTWSAIDGEIIDDISGEVVPAPISELIDNNDYVSMGEIQDNEKVVSDDNRPFITKDVEVIEAVEGDVDDSLLNVPDDQYILILKGKIVHIGSKKEVENLVSAMVFGELPAPNNESVPVEDIIVLKKIKIKVGLFLE